MTGMVQDLFIVGTYCNILENIPYKVSKQCNCIVNYMSLILWHLERSAEVVLQTTSNFTGLLFI